MEWQAALLGETSSLVTLLDAMLANGIARGFCVVLAGMLAFGLALLLLRKALNMRLGGRACAMLPGLMTTVGILGTFVGILMGLAEFDVADIDASIPKLLAGLTVAFSTSIAGMAAAVTFRVVDAFVPGRRRAQGAAVADIVDGLGRLERAMDKHTSEMSDALSRRGDVATTVRAGQDEMVEEFRKFAEHMTENTNKAFIEALEGVIRDFNVKINEQFGDNFKQLNAAVGALLEWQENYREIVEASEKRLDAATTAVAESERSLSAVSDHAAAIPTSIAALSPALATLNEQNATLASHLDTVGGLRERALEAFPVIEGNIEKLTTTFGDHVNRATRTAEEAIDRHEASSQAISERAEALGKSADEVRQQVALTVAETLDRIERDATKAFEAHGTLIEESASRVQQLVKTAWDNTEAGVDTRMKQFDEEMGKQLSKALNDLGNKLASLSSRFVEDYDPLTKRLQDIVRMARVAAE